MKKRNLATATLIIAAILFVLSYFFDDGQDDSLGRTMRDVAVLVLTTEGQINPPMVLTADTPTPEPIAPTVVVTSGIPTVLPPLTPADFYQIYFTTPTCFPEEQRTGGIDQGIADDLLPRPNPSGCRCF